VASVEPLAIAVIGGGGMIGGRVVREALDRDHAVTVVVRDPSKVAASHERLSVVAGDVLDAAIGGVVECQEVVVSAVGTARAAEPDYSIYVDAATSLVSVLRGLGPAAPRLIVVGGVGSLLDSSRRLLLERVPEDRRPEHDGQKAALDFYRTVSDVRWTYVCPPGRIEPGDRTGFYRLGEDELIVDEHGESSISMEDFAVALLDEAEQPRHIGSRFTVGY
jgi:putative NADH-flavin reductase